MSDSRTQSYLSVGGGEVAQERKARTSREGIAESLRAGSSMVLQGWEALGGGRNKKEQTGGGRGGFDYRVSGLQAARGSLGKLQVDSFACLCDVLDGVSGGEAGLSLDIQTCMWTAASRPFATASPLTLLSYYL